MSDWNPGPQLERLNLAMLAFLTNTENRPKVSLVIGKDKRNKIGLNWP